MISVEEALASIEANIQPAENIRQSLKDCHQSMLAEDVFSPIHMPPFKQSAMDGYALRLSETTTYHLIGEIQAGTDQTFQLKKGEGVRIFTGAPVPETADTVVMQEHVSRQDDLILLTNAVEKGANVRPRGEQLQKGALALPKGTLLNAAALGFLSGLGIATVKVYPKPKVAILITGDELQQPGRPLQAGQVYDSNSVSLQFALQNMGLTHIEIAYIPDNYEHTRDQIKEHLDTADVVLISGGISVGDYDFVKDALEENQVEELFYKVNQKPGKPLWFGKKAQTLVFALPGNPASSLSCFYVYVLPALRKMMGFEQIHLSKKTALTTMDIDNRFSKTLFLKGTVQQNKATPLTGQASSMLKSFAVSNALLLVPESVAQIPKGAPISYLDLNS